MANRLIDARCLQTPGRNGHDRALLTRQFTPKFNGDRPDLRALYDSATTTPASANYWPGTDNFDADRSNTEVARQQTRQKARWLVANEPLASGVVKTLANHRVGCGPGLQLLTQSDGFNAMVQQRWNEWDAASGFSEKLHTMSQSWDIDGESFAMLGSNPTLDCDVKLDLKLMETDQIFTPWLPWAVPNRIDGVWFDDWGNPTFYDVLRWHPGGVFPYWTWLYDTVPAQYIIQLMRRDRPNQHRGMSAFTPSLRLFAQRKRFLDAVIKAAETHASITILLETLANAIDDSRVPDGASIGATEIPQNLVAALPYGYTAKGFHAEQPTTTFEMFDRRLIAAIARPWSMPYAIAACDSSKTNFSSGRLDHQTYFAMIRVDQRLFARTVCTRTFREWFREACRVFRWSVADSPAPPHTWHFVEPEYCDPEAEANSIGTELAIGVASHSAVLTARGQDAKAVHKKAAEDLGFDNVPDYLAWVRANIAAKFGGLVRTPEPVLEEQKPSESSDQADVEAMAQILATASAEQKKAIAAWARAALAIGQAA